MTICSPANIRKFCDYAVCMPCFEHILSKGHVLRSGGRLRCAASRVKSPEAFYIKTKCYLTTIYGVDPSISLVHSMFCKKNVLLVSTVSKVLLVNCILTIPDDRKEFGFRCNQD